ncbi:MAG: putative integral membrane protein [Pseudohongiellaceae bacterium]|jgi:uncharacterized integral membrane protein|tara:strand:+ start:1031 stop:1228 length:198 start_codon:yes stop_codon:yes gene_type:complete
MNWKMIIGVAALILMGIFVIQNMEVVSVDFLIWSLQASRVIIYLSIFLLGSTVGWIWKSISLHKR